MLSRFFLCLHEQLLILHVRRDGHDFGVAGLDDLGIHERAISEIYIRQRPPVLIRFLNIKLQPNPLAFDAWRSPPITSAHHRTPRKRRKKRRVIGFPRNHRDGGRPLCIYRRTCRANFIGRDQPPCELRRLLAHFDDRFSLPPGSPGIPVHLGVIFRSRGIYAYQTHFLAIGKLEGAAINDTGNGERIGGLAGAYKKGKNKKNCYGLLQRIPPLIGR